MYTVFFEDRKFIIYDSSDSVIEKLGHVSLSTSDAFTTEIDNFANSNTPEIYINVPCAEQALEIFKKHYQFIQAAGGLVRNINNEILLIFRFDNWDLPKGKIEKKETPEQASIREVEEECGITNLIIGFLFLKTYHTYIYNGANILKETFWYNMNYKGCEVLKPQEKEDITNACWVPLENLDKHLNPMYSSVKEVLFSDSEIRNLLRVKNSNLEFK